MTPMFKARRSVFYSLLFVSIVCESFAAFGNNLKNTEPGNLQIAESDNPREVLKKTLSASQGVKSYRMRIEASSASKAIVIVEFASSGSIRTFKKNEEDHRISKEESIRTGKDIFYKEGDGPWKKYPEKKGDLFVARLTALELQKLIKSLAYAQDIKFIGQETVDGVPTLAYHYITDIQNRSLTIKIWIGVADGLLRRCEFERILGSTPLTVVYTFYDYNADIKIEPPTEYVSVTVPETVQVDPQAADPGPGEGGGMGAGKGSGMGAGDGRGVGPGSGYNAGGGAPGPGTGTGPGGVATVVDSRPSALNKPRPNYTEEARKNKIQGVVRVRVLVGADGSAKQVRLTGGGLPDGLNEEAISAAYKMRFKPAMKNGQPVAYWAPVDIEFDLRNDKK